MGNQREIVRGGNRREGRGRRSVGDWGKSGLGRGRRSAGVARAEVSGDGQREEIRSGSGQREEVGSIRKDGGQRMVVEIKKEVRGIVFEGDQREEVGEEHAQGAPPPQRLPWQGGFRPGKQPQGAGAGECAEGDSLGWGSGQEALIHPRTRSALFFPYQNSRENKTGVSRLMNSCGVVRGVQVPGLLLCFNP